MRYLVGTVVLALFGCSNPVGPVDVTTTSQQAIRIANGTSAPIYYFAMDANALALADWALPACTPASCDGIQPGEARTIPFSKIAAYTSSSTMAVVYWWHLRPAGGGTFASDSIRAVRVSLRPGA